MKPVYLCGPIMNRTDEECVAWRLRAAALLGPTIDTIDPVAARDCRGRELEPGMPAFVVEGDEVDIRRSGSILVMYDKPSVGTSMEIRIAFKEVRIPVFIVDVSGAPLSPWLIYHATLFFPNLVPACAFIRENKNDWS